MRLEIYVPGQNANQTADYQESLRLAEQARLIPGLDVDLITVDDGERHVAPVPTAPTSLLTSQVISMERSSWEGFFKHLRWQARAQAEGDGALHRPAAAPVQKPAAPSQPSQSLMTMDL